MRYVCLNQLQLGPREDDGVKRKYLGYECGYTTPIKRRRLVRRDHNPHPDIVDDKRKCMRQGSNVYVCGQMSPCPIVRAVLVHTHEQGGPAVEYLKLLMRCTGQNTNEVNLG